MCDIIDEKTSYLEIRLVSAVFFSLELKIIWCCCCSQKVVTTSVGILAFAFDAVFFVVTVIGPPSYPDSPSAPCYQL